MTRESYYLPIDYDRTDWPSDTLVRDLPMPDLRLANWSNWNRTPPHRFTLGQLADENLFTLTREPNIGLTSLSAFRAFLQRITIDGKHCHNRPAAQPHPRVPDWKPKPVKLPKQRAFVAWILAHPIVPGGPTLPEKYDTHFRPLCYEGSPTAWPEIDMLPEDKKKHFSDHSLDVLDEIVATWIASEPITAHGTVHNDKLYFDLMISGFDKSSDILEFSLSVREFFLSWAQSMKQGNCDPIDLPSYLRVLINDIENSSCNA
jgi:hypothetical protein